MVESIAYVLLLGRTVRATLGALSAGRRLYLVVLVLALVAGHLLDRTTATYPFVSWAMYAASVPPAATYYDYTAVRRSGREEPLPVVLILVLLTDVPTRVGRWRAGPDPAGPPR